MKVLCIDSKPSPNEYTGVMPIEGEVYTVERTTHGFDKIGQSTPCYKLEEIDYWLYHVDRFIPLSDIDERVLIKEREDILFA